MELYNKQNGKCHYSHVELVFKQKCNWQCSLERINPLLGYIKSNVALIALEFNTASQMTSDKFKEMIKLLYTNHQNQNFDFYKCRNYSGRVRSKKDIKNGMLMCNKCTTYNPLNHFRKDRTTCKSCRHDEEQKYKSSPKGHLNKVLKQMINSSKDRNHSPPEFDFDDLVELFNKQHGLCYYSGIPMTFGSYKDKSWILSAERLDNTKGYTKDNTVMVCWEFNVPHLQWSKEKIEHVKLLNPP